MCRAFLLLDVKGEKDYAKYKVLVNYVVNAYDKENRDGYFIAIDGEALRTMDFKEFMRFILEREEEIAKAKVIAGHLRASTTREVSEKWVHGWNFKGYLCYHNGIIYDYRKHDSYEFFEGIKRFSLKEIVRRLREKEGWGVFFAVNPKGKKFVFSRSHKFNVHLINGNFLAINSNDDIHAIFDTISYGIETIELGVLSFTKYKTISLRGKVREEHRASLEDCVLVFNERNIPVKLVEVRFPRREWWKKEERSKREEEWWEEDYNSYYRHMY